MNIGYKLVSNQDGRLLSFATPFWKDENRPSKDDEFLDLCVVEYKLNEWVYPNIPGTNLYVFSNHKYAYRYWPGIIYECEYIPSSRELEIVADIETAKTFIKNKLGKCYYNGSYLNVEVPSGTVAAESVKLIKRVI